MRSYVREHGTIHLSALDTHGDLGCTTTTSGLFYKIPGRVGDSPILGAGLYLDNTAGSAGSTGRGEANLLNLSSHTMVEALRRGLAPKDADAGSLPPGGRDQQAAEAPGRQGAAQLRRQILLLRPRTAGSLAQGLYPRRQDGRARRRRSRGWSNWPRCSTSR